MRKKSNEWYKDELLTKKKQREKAKAKLKFMLKAIARSVDSKEQ